MSTARHARPPVVAAVLLSLGSVHAQTGSITLVESDAAFEHEVMQSESCWAILFISNNTQEPTEHTQMRFELASATLAERIKLGIVAVHEVPESAAEFLTTETPQIGASDSRHVCMQRKEGVTHA